MVYGVTRSPLNIVIAGGSGMIGHFLCDELEARGHLVTRLVRRAPRNETEREWNPAQRILDPRFIDGADVVINLAGASINRLPWTYPIKKDIVRSRVNATIALTDAMHTVDNPPKVFLSGSATGAYGDRPGEVITEDSATATDGFLPRVVDQWERAALRAPESTRTVLLRTGIVLGRGGILTVLKTITYLGLMAQMGDGQQYWPWISLRDEVRAIMHLMRSELSGPVNLTGPTPATANEILNHLAGELKRPVALKAPSSLVEFTLQSAGRELILSSLNVTPKRLLEDGFQFRDQTAKQAVDAALRMPEPIGEEI